MCSVVGCYLGRRSAQRFKLPEDPEMRLEWVQFLATVNKQRFKESSWTDIAICVEHFKDDCFENYSSFTRKVELTLKPSAVPSLFMKSEVDVPEPHLKSPKCEESVETMEVACQCDHVKQCKSPTANSEESGWNQMAFKGSQVRRDVSSSTTDEPHGQVQPRNRTIDLIREKAERLQMKGKYVVNEKRLLQLFSGKCPSCGSKLRMQKLTFGLLLILNQQCLQCEYRKQWKSQVNANVPKVEDQHLTGGTEVTSHAQQESPTDASQSSVTGVHEIVAVIDEEKDHMDESEESSDQDEADSDEDWKPMKDSLLARVPQKKANGEDETEEEGENEEGDDQYPPLAPKNSHLCTDCGRFFNKFRPHTCEHKIKPFSCNICGKRFATEIALNRHSRIHDENYVFRCKYCHVTFKTKVDKFSHEQTHMTDGKPYKCPDCSETFATNKERRIHVQDHRGPPQLKCDFCGIEFCWPLALQRHLAVHTGEKRYKCSVCDRGFNQASHLKSHMRLHTGERPFKCQHCDKCFNHNVSLKSHVQRYHTSNLILFSNTVDAQNNGNKRCADSGHNNVEEDQDTEEEVQMERIYKPKYKKKSTGRPKGRPKSYESNTKPQKERMQRLKTTQSNDEENEDEQSDSDMGLHSAEEEEKRSKKAIQNTATSRGRAKKSNSEKSYSNYTIGKSSRKRRGRPRKNL